MKTVIKVALIALLWIIVVNPGRIYGDPNARLQIAHAWWTRTEEVIPPSTITPSNQPDARLTVGIGVLGRGGKRYIPSDPGQALLMLPADWLATQLHQIFPKQNLDYFRRMFVNWIPFVPLNVLVIISCYWLLKLFDFRKEIAGLASICLLLCTTVLHYAHLHQHNNQLLLCVTLGYATVLAYVQCKRSVFIILSGLALGTALLIRQTSVIHIVTVFGFLLGCVAYQSRNKLKVVKAAGLWIVGFIPLALASRILDYVRFGVFWTTGANVGVKQLNSDPLLSGLPKLPDNYPFIHSPEIGIIGALFSPAKSIFIYDPLLLPCSILGIFLWKKFSPYLKLYLIAGIFNLGLHLALYSKLDFWHGDAAWGARYHVTSVHLLLIPLIAFLIQNYFSSQKLIRKLIVGFLALVMIIQMSSIVLRPSAEIGRIYFARPSSFREFRLGERWKNIACLIDRSFASECPIRLKPTMDEPLIQRVSLLPFNFTQSFHLALIAWLLFLSFTVWATFHFIVSIVN
jgi:hypothetical protein